MQVELVMEFRHLKAQGLSPAKFAPVRRSEGQLRKQTITERV